MHYRPFDDSPKLGNHQDGNIIPKYLDTAEGIQQLYTNMVQINPLLHSQQNHQEQ